MTTGFVVLCKIQILTCKSYMSLLHANVLTVILVFCCFAGHLRNDATKSGIKFE